MKKKIIKSRHLFVVITAYIRKRFAELSPWGGTGFRQDVSICLIVIQADKRRHSHTHTLRERERQPVLLKQPRSLNQTANLELMRLFCCCCFTLHVECNTFHLSRDF